MDCRFNSRSDPPMKVIETIHELPARLEHPVVALGVFDGVHIGHQQIIREVVRRARDHSGTAIVLSFFPHPQKVIASGNAPPLLQTFEQQAEMLDQLGIDIFLRLPFTRRLSLLSPLEFVQDLLLRTGSREVHVGANFRFGHRRKGDFETLRGLGSQFGFTVKQTAIVRFRGTRVSSTVLRALIREGQVALAKRLLGRPYEIRGSIVKGARRGIELGFPTANLKPDNELAPTTGVYVTRAFVNGAEYVGATNIGFRPTIQGFREPEPTIETHLLGFSGDLYGQAMRLQFCFRIRPERRFDTADALIQRIRKDILWVQKYSGKTARLLSEGRETRDEGRS